MTLCPYCSRPTHPKCPVCGAEMQNNDRRINPTFGRAGYRILSHKWVCSQSDGLGTRHYVELEVPHHD